MNIEQGILATIGELRALVANLQERNNDLQNKLDSMIRTQQSIREVETRNKIVPVDKEVER